MYFTDLTKQILFSLWSHQGRTILALFGIVWGTITVIILLALSNGFFDASMKNLSFLNNGTIFGWAARTSKPYAGLAENQKIHLREKDFLDMSQDISGVKLFIPVYSTTGELHYKNNHINTTIQGVAAGYEETQQMKFQPGGRFIDALDMANRNNVVFLGGTLQKILFGDENPLHETVMIQGIPFIVIGVNDLNNKSAIHFMPESAIIPYTTYLAIFGQQDIQMLFVTPMKANETPRIKRSMRNILAMKFHYDPTDDEAFRMPDLESRQVFVTWFFRIIELFLSFCGALTLSVGGLGIANMMFLIVTERRREIGLRMALGAGQSHIMAQFLLETLFLVSIGGLIGALFSSVFLALLRYLPLPEWLGTPHISWSTVLMTVVILGIVGLVAGYFPARRASKMEPVHALAF